MISPHAIVEAESIGQDVRIEPFAVVCAGAIIGDGAVIHPHVVINPGVKVGARTEVFPGAYLGKPPRAPSILLRQPTFEPELSIGADCVIGPNAVIYYDVVIGEQCLIGDGAVIREQARLGQRCKVGPNTTFNYAVTVGDDSQIANLVHVAGNTVIGQRVFVSMGVTMVNDNSFGRGERSDNPYIAPHIKDDCRIGPGAILMPAVIIGPNAVVGGGAVVSRDVAPFSVVMGIPARHVRNVDEH